MFPWKNPPGTEKIRQSYNCYFAALVILLFTMEEKPRTFVPAKQGGQKLKDSDGYLYNRLSRLPLKMRSNWYCSDKRILHCTATAVTNDETNCIIKKTEHNHLVLLLEIQAKNVEKQLVDLAAIMPTVAPRTVVGAVAVHCTARQHCPRGRNL